MSVRLPPSLISEIDEEAKRLEKERPHETITRATAIKSLLTAGALARKHPAK